MHGSLAGQTRRTVVGGTAAAVVPLPALATSASAAAASMAAAPVERAEYRDRLLTAYEEDRLRRPIGWKADAGPVEEHAALLVGARLWTTAREVLALPPPATIDGLGLAALATAVLIAVLDGMDSDPDQEDGGDAEPSLAAPENTTGSQVTWLRGNDADREAEAPETTLPEVAAEPLPSLP